MVLIGLTILRQIADILVSFIHTISNELDHLDVESMNFKVLQRLGEFPNAFLIEELKGHSFLRVLLTLKLLLSQLRPHQLKPYSIMRVLEEQLLGRDLTYRRASVKSDSMIPLRSRTLVPFLAYLSSQLASSFELASEHFPFSQSQMNSD